MLKLPFKRHARNERETMPEEQKEVCSIRIIFPVESDEKAIDYKRKIAALLAEVADAQIQFSLGTMPIGMPVR